MIKLKDLLYERVDIYSVTAVLVSDKKTNFTDIVNGVRGVRKVTTVNVITPDEMEAKNKSRKDGKEVHVITIKFIGSKSPKDDLVFLRNTMMKSDAGDPNKKIFGLQTIEFKEDTLNRI